MLNTHELAWAAGLFDGEGYASANRGYRRKGQSRTVYGTLTLSVTQVDRRVLDRFCTAVGVGKVLGPYKTKNPNRKPVFRFYASSFEHIQMVVSCLWPWLSPVKKAQVKGALVNWLSRPRLITGRKSG